MRFFKIAEKVALVTAGRKTLTDKDKVYPETLWRGGQCDELLRRGFLVEVAEDGEAIIAAEAVKELEPRSLTENEMLEEADLPEGSELEPGEPVAPEDLNPVDEEELKESRPKKGKKK
jgi:hypothetical protein